MQEAQCDAWSVVLRLDVPLRVARGGEVVGFDVWDAVCGAANFDLSPQNGGRSIDGCD
jgi:hypothetical protein